VTVDIAAQLRRGLLEVSWGRTDLWLAAVALGGSLDLRGVRSIVSGERQPTRAEYELLAAALNEESFDRGQDHPIRTGREVS
jgi:hypothetical protein